MERTMEWIRDAFLESGAGVLETLISSGNDDLYRSDNGRFSIEVLPDRYDWSIGLYKGCVGKPYAPPEYLARLSLADEKAARRRLKQILMEEVLSR